MQPRRARETAHCHCICVLARHAINSIRHQRHPMTISRGGCRQLGRRVCCHARMINQFGPTSVGRWGSTIAVMDCHGASSRSPLLCRKQLKCEVINLSAYNQRRPPQGCRILIATTLLASRSRGTQTNAYMLHRDH